MIRGSHDGDGVKAGVGIVEGFGHMFGKDDTIRGINHGKKGWSILLWAGRSD